jgi:ABC-type antimicrobial peptide transport system ATPase subunit
MPLLDVRHLTKHFVGTRGLFRAPSVVKAVDDVSFAIDEGEMFGLSANRAAARARPGDAFCGSSSHRLAKCCFATRTC